MQAAVDVNLNSLVLLWHHDVDTLAVHTNIDGRGAQLLHFCPAREDLCWAHNQARACTRTNQTWVVSHTAKTHSANVSTQGSATS
jgi:D-hexose-6-phosphate mutarotase